MTRKQYIAAGFVSHEKLTNRGAPRRKDGNKLGLRKRSTLLDLMTQYELLSREKSIRSCLSYGHIGGNS